MILICFSGLPNSILALSKEGGRDLGQAPDLAGAMPALMELLDLLIGVADPLAIFLDEGITHVQLQY